MKLKFNDIKCVGVYDNKIDLFEGQFEVEEGISYNSYLILDEKTALIDTVDEAFFDEWLKNVEDSLNGKHLDYLIVEHMEPDHSANIKRLMDLKKDLIIVSSQKAFQMLSDLYEVSYNDRMIQINENDSLNLGKHNLKFISASMVHWPEVMMIYDEYTKAFFSADAFGKFGPLSLDDWACEARRYYFGIVGKYGLPVMNLFKKIANLEISAIYPLHGPVLEDNLSSYLSLYQTWASYTPETKGVFIAYTSVYGNTKRAALYLCEELKKKNIKVALADLARTDIHEDVEDAFRYSHIILATTTYNGDIFPIMKNFINELIDRSYQNRTIGLIGNGLWANQANKVMKSMFEKSKNITFLNQEVNIKGGFKEINKEEVKKLIEEINLN